MVNASVAANKQVVSFIVRVFVAQLRGIDSQFIPSGSLCRTGSRWGFDQRHLAMRR